MRDADLVIVPSERSKLRLMDTLQLPSERVQTVSLAVDNVFSDHAHHDLATTQGAENRFGLKKPFVLHFASNVCTTLRGLINSFVLLEKQLQRGHSLAAICPDVSEHELKALRKFAQKAGMQADDLALISGDVCGLDLAALYRRCALFVPPSWRWDSSLTALEAMACGAPVLGAERPSIADVLGWSKASFEPENPRDLARKLERALEDKAFRAELLAKGRERVQTCSWQKTTTETWAAFEKTHRTWSRPKHVPTKPFRSRLALLGRHAPEIIRGLSPHYDLELISTDEDAAPLLASPDGITRSVEWFAAYAPGYDRIVYCLTTPAEQPVAAELLTRFPGALLLQDERRTQPAHARLFDQPDENQLRLLHACHGYPALIAARETPSNVLELFPLMPQLLENATGVLRMDGEASTEGLGAWIEETYASGEAARRQILLRKLGESTDCRQETPSDQDMFAVSACVANNMPAHHPPRLYVDISGLELCDAKTGIHRVVRSVLSQLLRNPPEGYRCEPVYLSRGVFFHARRFTWDLLGFADVTVEDEAVDLCFGDLLLGLDLNTDLAQCENKLIAWRNRGVKIVIVVYDLLPLRYPEYFEAKSSRAVTGWLKSIARSASGIVAISRSVEDELTSWLEVEAPPRSSPLHLGYFYLGADITSSPSSRGFPEDAEKTLQIVRAGQAVLMVGTIEPRKGYTQAVDAFEKYWTAGGKAKLVIVGNAGWKMKSMIKRMRSHPERNKRLLWLEGVSDEYLEKLYAACSGLLFASRGEGFGLPLVEAARHKKPILARKLPVLEEVLGEHATYFSGHSAAELSVALGEWLERLKMNTTPPSKDIPWLTWRESTAQLMRVVFQKQWC